MTLFTGMGVTVVVWAVSLVGPVRLRAWIYSLPVPITLALIATRIPVDAQQLLGILLLNVFVATVTWAYRRLHWHILLADLAGITAYVAGSWAFLRSCRLSFATVLAVVVAVWAMAVGLQQRSARKAQPSSAQRETQAGEPAVQTQGKWRSARLAAGKLLVIAFGTLVTVGLARLLRGMVVTFPYAGVLVVIETRRDLAEFRARFTRNSLALLAFLTVCYLTQASFPRYLEITFGWAGFACCALLLYVGRFGAKVT
jgi:hypothetical protein